MPDHETLKYLQSMSLEDKIDGTKLRIKEWYKAHSGKVCVSFSGGKDSTVLLDIVRSVYPDIVAVFSDTGLEFPEIKSFVRSYDNVIILKPKLSFKQVLEKYGYPLISKENSQKIQEIRNTKSKKLFDKRMNGENNRYKSGKLPDKWKFLIDAPFKISPKCCDIIKKQPFNKYVNKENNYPILGVMAEDSKFRKQSFMRYGCNAFNLKHPQSRPMIFWTEKDVWEYIKWKNLSYCSVYDMGYQRTGCLFCGFGIHFEERQTGTNRFKLLKMTHPKLWNYCVNDLGMREVMNYCGISVE